MCCVCLLPDLGLELMHEVAFFKESVFTLRGDISFVKHRERMSRDGTALLLNGIRWLRFVWVAHSAFCLAGSCGEHEFARQVDVPHHQRRARGHCVRPSDLHP
jgi:hypothetical protein